MWSLCTNCKRHVYETILQIGFVVIMDADLRVYILFCWFKNCNHGCRSVCEYIIFLALSAGFLTVYRQELVLMSFLRTADRNYR